MIAQEAFDKVCRHLAGMTHRAYDDDMRSCVYRNDDGDRCAIGGLLTNSLLDNPSIAWYEGAVNGLVKDYIEVDEFLMAGVDPFYRDVHLEFLEALQNIHDDERHWARNANGDETGFKAWDKLADLADQYDLDTTVLEEVKS